MSELTDFLFKPYAKWEEVVANGGPWFAPHGGGYYWRQDGKTYWQNGDITEWEACVRVPANGEVEDFRKWSDEKRHQVRMEFAAKRREYQQDRAIKRRIRAALVASAKSKLTTDEYDALFNEGFFEGRGCE